MPSARDARVTMPPSTSASSPQGVREVSPREVQAWSRAGDVLIVDVREPDEHRRERIAGATLVPLSRFEASALGPAVKPGQRIVLHCRGGARSADAARRCAALAQSGIEVLSMRGGLEAWKQEQLPVEVDRSVARLSILRQVQLTIGIVLLAGAALAWFGHPAFIAIHAFVAVGLIVAGATGTCALASLFGVMPWNRGGSRCSTTRLA